MRLFPRGLPKRKWIPHNSNFGSMHERLRIKSAVRSVYFYLFVVKNRRLLADMTGK